MKTKENPYQYPNYTDKCLVCNEITKNCFWVYIWNKKMGYCCQACGQAVHVAGYKILHSVENILRDHNLHMVDSKEKFGAYRLSVIADTVEQKELALALFDQAIKDFPEFMFDFSVSHYVADQTQI